MALKKAWNLQQETGKESIAKIKSSVWIPRGRRGANGSVPIKGHHKDDKARVGDESVTKNNVPVCKVISGLEVEISFTKKHDFRDITNDKEQVYHIRNRQ